MSQTFSNIETLERLRRHAPVSAAWAQLGSNLSAEILAEAGFDILVVDMEHAPITIERLISLIQATKGTGCIPFVRAPWNDMVWCKQILDAGAYGVHIPYVSSREEAEYAVKSCKYPPAGFRGIAGSQRAVSYGLHKEAYYAAANPNVTVVVAIETGRGVENLDEILSVEGVDGVFIGPADLSADLGHLNDPGHPEVQAAIRKIEEAAARHGKFLGTVAKDAAAAQKLYDRGYALVYFMSDVTALSSMAASQVAQFQAANRT